MRQPLSLNKISIDGPAWLASDIHLGPDNPKTAQAFYAFLDQAGARAGALFLLGDIFDVWIGDDCCANPPVWLKESLDKLRETAAKVPLWIGRGNRDFLMGQALCDHINAQLIKDQCLLEVGHQQVLLAHGDEFCTTDLAYQRFRRLVRHRWTQTLFLSLGLRQRQAIANRARQKSMQTQAIPNAVWHDVHTPVIAQTLRQMGVCTLVHGHTHRPGHYVETVQQQLIDRWVLPDWESDHLDASQIPRGGWLIIEDDGINLFDLTGQKMK